MLKKKLRVTEPYTYKVMMDWWVILPVSLLLILMVAIIPMLTILDITHVEQLVVGLIVSFTILYIVDTAFFTYYLLTDTALIVASQMRHFEFPYRAMREVRPIGLRGLFSFRGRKRFSASLHGYQISLRGEHWKTITISPVNRDTFISELMEHVEQERSGRATVVRS